MSIRPSYSSTGPSNLGRPDAGRGGAGRPGAGTANAGRINTGSSRGGATNASRMNPDNCHIGLSGAAQPGEKYNGAKPINTSRPGAGPSTADPLDRGRHPNNRSVTQPSFKQPPFASPSSKVETPIKSTDTGPVRLPCTYPKCEKYFTTKRDMSTHKLLEHEYCDRCDEDYADEERLLLHKIISPKHIVCPVCGVDFRSTGGRDVHIRQNHRAEQSIDCRGCTKTFKSASALMGHIEENGCRRIPRARLLQQQETRLMIAEILDGDRPIHPDDIDDNDGGVMLDGTPVKSPVSPRSPKANAQKSPMPSPNAQKVKSSPLSQQVPGSPSTCHSHTTEESMVTATSRMPVTDADDEIVPHRTAIELEKDKSLEWDLFGRPDATAGDILRRIDPDWDASKFLNMAGSRFVCHCRVSYRLQEDFEAHMLEKVRDKKPLGCPYCFRNFKRSADLVSHIESGSNRCSMSSGALHSQVVDQLTGGVVRVAGRLPDGTIKYEAGNVEPLYEPDHETTLVGVDSSYRMANVEW
ncbi:putative C2H2 finger domain protein [Aspergillus homomorphus CBS 101889]|uniref:C2H2-type domain-containing protein n=1 Tax=Aspergillus homomorphus (strain CBS 101889) TaxID=1450537 RepID=A0A395I9Q5_ASPHC|nr:hypothetical protein BO97DRAFT_441362 [Aspergillus homomorphus CBS 101889]RAL14874.1 hypothetical protein BO97DRAFT_441362 [Aspergillus homomorphus CBS 101889]